MSTLTTRHLVAAIAVLNRIGDLTPSTSPAELGRIQAQAYRAALDLRVHGIPNAAVPVLDNREPLPAVHGVSAEEKQALLDGREFA